VNDALGQQPMEDASRLAGRLAGRLAVLIPAHGETDALARVIRDLARVLPGVPVWVVVDGAGDPSSRVALAEGANLHVTNETGYANALYSGYKRLLSEGIEAVVQLDADGQHPPEEAPALIEELAQADAVFASRAGTGSPSPLARRVGHRLMAWWLRVWTGGDLQDPYCGFQVLNQKALKILTKRQLPGYADAAPRARLLAAGLVLLERPVTLRSRCEGISMHDGPAALLHFARSLLDVPVEVWSERAHAPSEGSASREGRAKSR
jgi:hypothetical protein